MKYAGQIVRLKDDHHLGTVCAVYRTTTPHTVKVNWGDGVLRNYKEDQLLVVCPTCAGRTGTFSRDQCERQKKECDICQEAKP